MPRHQTSAARAARLAAAVTAALLLSTAGHAEAARNVRFESLCGRSVTGLVLVAGRDVGLTEPCVIHIRAGGVLRIADADISGFPRLHLRLYGGGSLELRRSVLTNESLTISGDGSVLAEDARISAFNNASIDVTGDVSLTRSGMESGGTLLRSSAGRVALSDATVGARFQTQIRAGRGVSLLWSGVSSGQSAASIEIGDRGDLTIIASTLSGPIVSLTPRGAAASITLTGSDVNAFREPFDWPSTMLPPDRCAASDNLPDIACPFAPEELPDAPSGPRP
jgi:hypothetical protein